MYAGWKIVAVCGASLVLVLAVTVESQSVYVVPDAVYAKNGDSVNLTCHHVFNPNTTVLWKKQLGNSENEGTVQTDSTTLVSGQTLQILHFNASKHAGQYSCSVVSLQKERITSCPSDVIVAYTDFQHVIQPENTIAYSGTTAVFHCNIKLSVPKAQISWTHNKQPLDSFTDTSITVMPSGNLYISSIDSSRSGSYQCIATNSVTMDHWHSAVALLTVLERMGNETYSAPSFLVEPEDSTAWEGTTVILECAGQGNPQPSVNWKKTGSSNLPEGASVHITGALIITNVSATHIGSYICSLGTNMTSGLEVQKEVNLTIIGNPVLDQVFVFTEDADSRRPGIVCVARANSILEGDCQQKLYLLYNGLVIDESTGDNLASIIYFFDVSLNMTTTELFQCMSITPGGCSVVDVQATFLNGVITEETVGNYSLSNLPTSTACEVSTHQPVTVNTEPENTSTTDFTVTTQPICGSTMQGDTDPILEVNIPPSETCATAGSLVMFTCAVTGPASGPVNVTWLFNNRDLLANPLENVLVELTAINGSVAEITAILKIATIKLEHAGSYTCIAHSVCPAMHASSTLSVSVKPADESTESVASTGDATTVPIPRTNTEETTTVATTAATEPTATNFSPSTLTSFNTEGTTSTTAHIATDSSPTINPSRPPSRSPTNLNAVTIPTTRNVHLHWNYSDTKSISGFKINWDTADRISTSAREVVSRNVFQFVISSSLYDISHDLVVHVWAYNDEGDGPHSAYTIEAFEGTSTMSPMTITEVTSGVLTSSTTLNQILECAASARSPTMVELTWPDFLKVNDSSVRLIASCEEANTLLSTSFPASLSSYVIHQALPSCTYTYELQFVRHIAACKVITPQGQVDVGANVTRLPNGSTALRFHLPPELRDEPDLAVEGNWGEGWSPLSMSHIPSHLDSSKEHQVEVRLLLGKWEGYVNITVPSATNDSAEEEEEGQSVTDTVLLYGIIFGTLLITCTILLAIILGLKHVQWSHRESDKERKDHHH